jgi:Meiotically up-regulated gene 113
LTIDAETLKSMIAEDDLGLLTLPAKRQAMTKDERLVASFGEIKEFVSRHGRPPDKEADDVTEMMLAHRLGSMSVSDEQRELLAPHDDLGILLPPKPPESLEEAVAEDSLGLLEAPGEDIHTLRHVPKPSAQPEEIARRRPCEDFESFEPLFKACHDELRSGARRLIKFRDEQAVREGAFYVLNGVLVLVAEEGERKKLEDGRLNARLRCVFENATEADLLLRSFASRLYRFGKTVTEPEEKTQLEVEEQLGGESGFVYVARSLSGDPEVRAIPDLYKIGFTTGSAEQRVADAIGSATFLDAQVELVDTFELPRSIAGKVEALIHRFFAAARIDAWFEREGRPVADAREWFSVPREVIAKAMELIESEGIKSYEYDPDERRIKLRS